MEPKFIKFTVDGYKALAFYEYSEFIKRQIYVYKGCFDYEMKDRVLNLFIKEIKMYYQGYKIIPAPSYFKDDETRGFNHVVEVFKQLGLDMCQIVTKTERFKQAEKSAKERQSICKHLSLTSNTSLSKYKVLIVDDIYTTGATMKSMIKLIESLHPKDIKVLVLVKTKDVDDKKSNTKQSLH